jgi:hypothetical protein
MPKLVAVDQRHLVFSVSATPVLLHMLLNKSKRHHMKTRLRPSEGLIGLTVHGE